jgi:hypothetical protein
MLKRIFPLLFVTLGILGRAEVASACSCFGGLMFDENVKHSKPVLLGRVKAQGQQEILNSTQPLVAYLDVEVVEIYKGTLVGAVIRIWDANVGTNCGGGLAELTPGKLVGLVVEENKDPHSMSDLWNTTGIRPSTTDYLVGACSEYSKVFKTERGARRYMRRLTH